MITHIVTFKLHDPAEAERCKTMLDGLFGTVPSLRTMTVGTTSSSLRAPTRSA